MKRAILAACLLCLSVAAFAGQPDAFSAGKAAYKAGNYPIALADFQLAAQQGDVRAQFLLGYMYDQGQGGVPQDFAEAVKWYRLAAQQGDADAQFDLGGMYYKGHGVPQNYAKALQWYRLAAQQRDSHALGALGVMYIKGNGVPQSYAEALKWLYLAKAQDASNSGRHQSLSRIIQAIERALTAAQITQAQQEAVDWSKAHPKAHTSK